MIEFNYGLYDRYTNIDYNTPADWDDAPPILRIVGFRASVRMAKSTETAQYQGQTQYGKKGKTKLIPIIEAETSTGLYINRTSDLKGKITLQWHRTQPKGKDRINRADNDFTLRHKGEWDLEVNSDELALNGSFAEFWFSFSAPEASDVLRIVDERLRNWAEKMLHDMTMIEEMHSIQDSSLEITRME